MTSQQEVAQDKQDATGGTWASVPGDLWEEGEGHVLGYPTQGMRRLELLPPAPSSHRLRALIKRIHSQALQVCPSRPAKAQGQQAREDSGKISLQHVQTYCAGNS